MTSPVQVRGHVAITPFEANLVGWVFDGAGNRVGEAPITVAGELGAAGTFVGEIPFASPAGGPGRVELVEISPMDGSVVARAAVDVTLAATEVNSGPVAPFEVPAAGERLVLPVHVLARAGQAGEQLDLVLRWQDGTELRQPFTALAGEDGRGLVIGNVDWMTESQPPQPPSQPATLEVRRQSGELLVQQNVVVVSAADPGTREVTLYWLIDETLQPVARRIIQTQRIGTATLEQLLWGPSPGNLAGFTTAIPTPEEVLASPGREPDWGARVTVRSLAIQNGVALADFSQEMRAYGGDPLRAQLIRDQITQSLLQFSTVQEVRITIEGQVDPLLQP